MLRNDAAVRGDDTEVSLSATQRVGHVGWLQTVRLIDRDPSFEGERFHGSVADLLSSATWPIWLGDYACDRMRRIKKAPQGGHRELRCPEEHHYHLPVRESFLIFRTIKSF
jgi:hypothetical protein